MHVNNVLLLKQVMYVFIYCSTVYIFNKKFYLSVLHYLSCIKSADILERQQLIVESNSLVTKYRRFVSVMHSISCCF